MASVTVNGWITIGGQIHQSVLKVNWDSNTAIVLDSAEGCQYVGCYVTDKEWSITLDRSKIIARAQVEKIFKSLDSDPATQSTWIDYRDAVRLGEVIVHRFIP